MSQYVLGQVVRLGVTFVRASTGLDKDPTVTTFSYKPPSGAAVSEIYGTDPDPQRSAEGKFFRDLTLNEVGTWFYRWEGTGDVTTANEDSLAVKASMFG